MACVAELVLSAIFTTKQDARYAYVCPQYNQAKDVAWLYIKRLTADIPGVAYNETELRADLPNGSRIRLYGADNPDRLRGLYLDGVVLDEFADMRSSVWGEVVRPMLADRKGWAVFIGTPKGHNDFYRSWVYAKNAADWFALMLKASDSGLIDADELKDAARGMTEDQYAQEFECSFEAAIAGAYFAKDIVESQIREVPVEPEAPVFTAWDIGYSDDTAIWFYQVVRGEIHVIDFYSTNGQGVEHYAKVLSDKAYNYAKLGSRPFLWLPHDARAKTFASGGKSTQEQFFALGYASRIVPELSLQDGIQAVRMALPRMWFDADKCKDGIEALKLYRREWDSDKKVFRDKPLHDWTSHAADAARYMALAWQAERPAEDTPETRWPAKGTAHGTIQTATLDEMWASTKREKRI